MLLSPLYKQVRGLVARVVGPFEVNRRSVLSSHSGVVLAWLRSVLELNFHLQSPIKKAYNENMKKVEKIAINNAEKLMCEAAQRLSQLAASEDEENVLVIDGQSVAKVAVSIDGTRQKRGHSSKIGGAYF